MLAGRDLAAGGTWLGVTGAGRFAAVTNIFEGAAAPAERSRGELATGFLSGTVAPSDYAKAREQDQDRYGPFNLIVGHRDQLHFVSNRFPINPLDAGIHVFSNNTPGLEWAKVGALAEAIQSAIDCEDLRERLIERLSGPAARGPLERASEALFVVGETFGTRCTTVMTVDALGRADFVEQRFGAGGFATGRSEFAFDFSL
jgi:uncharacterized protein with NRDE domain